MSYSEVEQALQACGLRRREARARLVLGQEDLRPHDHGLHSHRRWTRVSVERYCQQLTQRLQEAA